MGFSRQEYWSELHALLQGIFPTQGLNPGLLHCRQILYCLRNPQIQWLALLLYWLYFSGTQPARSPRCVCYDLSKRLVKAMVFPVVMYGCESRTVKKDECQRIDAFELWCWRRLLRVPWTARRSNQFILKETSPGCERVTEDEMVGWHHWLNEHKFEQTPGDGKG